MITLHRSIIPEVISQPDTVLPLYLVVDDTSYSQVSRRQSLTPAVVRMLITAAVHDLLSLCARLDGISPRIICARPWTALRQQSAPCEYHSLSVLMNASTRPFSAGLAIAADAPTVPPGYLQTAIDALRSQAISTVYGPTLGREWYLTGWGNGTGTMVLPSWYRIGEAEGLSRTKRDLQRGAVATETAALLRRMDSMETQGQTTITHSRRCNIAHKHPYLTLVRGEV